MGLNREEKLLKNFGARVATVRKSRKMTQQVLAEKTGLSVVAIAYIETGKRWPRIESVDKIARTLKVPVSILFEGIEKGVSGYSATYTLPDER